MKLRLAAIAGLMFIQANAFANTAEVMGSGYTQSIQVVNLLANPKLASPNKTESDVIVKFFNNGGSNNCWNIRLNYRDDTYIHAGPTQGCVTKVSKVVIEVIAAPGFKAAYDSPYTVNIDTDKYSTQMQIVQKEGLSPSFDPESGMVQIPGVMEAKAQAMLR